MSTSWLPAGVNALRCRFEPALLLPLQALAQPLIACLQQQTSYWEGGFYRNQALNQDFQLISYDTYPLFWISPRHVQSHRPFEQFFAALAASGLHQMLRQRLDCRKQVMMYGGFFVAGDRAIEPMWHYDYRAGAQGYTLITPLFAPAADHGGLWYQAPGQKLCYRYQLGEALVFGEGFLHSTAPYGPATTPRILLSLTLGSDKMRHWPLLKPNIAEQALFFRLPCGHFQGSCQCESKRWHWG